MLRIAQYLLLFVATAALQLFLFDNLSWGYWVHPFIYLAFVLLLPMEIGRGWLLLLAAGAGAAMDFFSGAPGVNTAATTAAAFCRPALLQGFVGKELVGDGGMPNVRRVGGGKFFRYAFLTILVHVSVFYTLETLSAAGLFHTLLRVAASTACTLAAVWLVQAAVGGRN